MTRFTRINNALLILANPGAPDWGEALHYLLHHAPEPLRGELRAGMDRAMKVAGLRFTQGGYLEDGAPAVTLSEVTARLGLTEDEVEVRVREMEAQDGTRYLHTGKEIHRPH